MAAVSETELLRGAGANSSGTCSCAVCAARAAAVAPNQQAQNNLIFFIGRGLVANWLVRRLVRFKIMQLVGAAHCRITAHCGHCGHRAQHSAEASVYSTGTCQARCLISRISNRFC